MGYVKNEAVKHTNGKKAMVNIMWFLMEQWTENAGVFLSKRWA